MLVQRSEFILFLSLFVGTKIGIYSLPIIVCWYKDRNLFSSYHCLLVQRSEFILFLSLFVGTKIGIYSLPIIVCWYKDRNLFSSYHCLLVQRSEFILFLSLFVGTKIGIYSLPIIVCWYKDRNLFSSYHCLLVLTLSVSLLLRKGVFAQTLRGRCIVLAIKISVLFNSLCVLIVFENYSSHGFVFRIIYIFFSNNKTKSKIKISSKQTNKTKK